MPVNKNRAYQKGMALIKLGSLAQDVRGSQNGLTFSRNKGGAYVRQKVTPVNPNTSAQRGVRAAFAANSKLWSGTMTAAQRAAWVAYASTYPYTNIFGDSSVLTGLAMSMAKNQVLNQLAVAAIVQPPVDNSVAAIPAATTMTANHTTPIISIATPAQSAAADTDYYVFMTPALPAGRNPSESTYRFVGSYAPSAAGVTVGAAGVNYGKWAARFGALTVSNVGNIIWAVISQVSISKGNVTVGVKLSAVVT